MEKRNYRYSLELKELSLKNGSEGTKKLSFDFENHDDLFQIFEAVRSRKIFSDDKTADEFALGLKLLTEVMLKNNQHPLFEELRPAIKEFMQKLKRF